MKQNYFSGQQQSPRQLVGFWLLLAALAAPAALHAQTYQLPVAGATTITTCAGTLYDDGGPTGVYAPYANGSTTIMPGTAGSKVRLQFNTVTLETYYDHLYVYDGTSTSAPLIGSYDSNNQPGTLYGTTASGALTVRLTSDGSGQYDGFAATIGCVTTLPPQTQPDLTVRGAQLSPTSVVAGGSTYASSAVYNLSGTTANSSNMGYYLSADAVLDASDVLLNYTYGYAIGVGQSSGHYTTLTVPAGTTAGGYYVLFVADYRNQVAESNETNNVMAVGLTVTPPSIDLTIQQPSISPTNPAPGTALSMSCYINNQGNAVSPSSSVGFYLSNDATLDAADQLLTSQYGGQLYTNYPSQRYGTAAVPNNLAPGTYFILFVADYQNQVAESNETNNVSALSFVVNPPGIDLVIQQEQLYPPTTVAGNSVQLSCTVLNQGNTMAPSSTVGFYLSTNAVFDASDVLLITSTGYTLPAYQASARYTNPMIPTGTAPGSYYVLFVADPADAVAEVNETNNVRSLPLTIMAPTIDLANNSVYLSPATVGAGGSTQASSYLYNLGNAPASPATLGYYLSVNQVLDASDVLLGSNTGTVNGGSSVSRNAALPIPAGTALGNYYILFVADYLNQVAETNETNNVSSYPLQIVAPVVDLLTTQPYLSPSVSAAGNSISTSCFIQNQGNSTASSSNVGYYLSTNTVFDASDVLLLNLPGGALVAGGYQSRYTNLTIPAGTAGGNYFVLFVADPTNLVAESNESNNVSSTPLLLLAPGIDLIPQQPQLFASNATPGFGIQANCNVINSGTTTAPGSSLGYYLSTDQTLDASDVLLTTITGYALYSGQSSSRQGTLVVPTGTAAGSYYVLFVADPDNNVAETNETNNVTSLPLTVNPPFSGNVVPVSGTATVTSCSTAIYDNGGLSNYADNSNGSLTLLPATAGSMVQLTFTSFETQYSDIVSVYDGTSTSAPRLGTYSGYYQNNLPLPLTATNQGGALTVVFSSDAYGNAAGFAATVSCVSAPLSDLLLTQIGASPSTVPAGNNVGLSATVANQGGGVAPSSAVGYYLSADQVLSVNDLLLGTSPGAALGLNLTATRTLTAPVPAGTVPGSYYVLFVADPANAVAESNETNNVEALRLTVTQATATRDQTAGYTVAVAPNPVASGQPLRVALDGAGPTGTATVELYNALGQRVQSQSLLLSSGRANRAEVATQGLASGVYTLRLTGAGLSVTRRVLIN